MTIDVLAHNRHAWNWAAENGQRWSTPVAREVIDRARQGDLELALTPTKKIPTSWLGCVKGKHILGLASGGGQQGPVLAAAGAHVTIADLSPGQLAQDRLCAEKYNLQIVTIETSAADLKAIPSKSIDMIVNPLSNCFFPDLDPVWKECARVLKPNGVILYAFIAPISYQFDFEKANQGEFVLKYAMPYSDHTSLSQDEQKRFLYPEAPLEFGHSLTDQMTALMHEGFVIEDLYEDYWGDKDKCAQDKFFPTFIAVKARKTKS